MAAALKANTYPVLSCEAEQLTVGSNISRDPLEECIERRPWNHLGSSAKTPKQTEDILGHVILIEPETASGIMFTQP